MRFSLAVMPTTQLRVKLKRKERERVSKSKPIADLVSLRFLPVASVAHQANRVKKVTNEHGFENVELEVSVGAGNRDGSVVAHHLGTDHGHGLALRGVDFARHDRRARLVLWQAKFTKTATRARSEQANVVGNLHHRAGKGVDRAAGFNDRVVGGKSFEFVGGSSEGVTRDLGDFFGDLDVKATDRVETGANGGAALSERVETRQGALDSLNAVFDLSSVTRKLLAESKRGGVLQVGTPDLDNVLEFDGFRLECSVEGSHVGEQTVLDFHDGANVHSSRETVVGRLTHVDVVVGVNGLLASELAAEHLDGTVGNDFVDIHVGLSSRTSLPDDERKVVREFAFHDLSAAESHDLELV